MCELFNLNFQERNLLDTKTTYFTESSCTNINDYCSNVFYGNYEDIMMVVKFVVCVVVGSVAGSAKLPLVPS